MTDFLGPYRLVKLIRAGQTAQVWEALKDPDPKRIAVKVLLNEHAESKTAIEHLKREAEAGKDLESRYVIRIYEFNGKHSRPFVAMQLFNARNLKQWLREDPEFTAYHLEDALRRAAKGIAYLHSKGWVHCDIKPDNFLMDYRVNVKLIDFSIAEKIRKGGGLGGLFNRRGKVRGTRSYMSPEQIRGKSIDERSDIYGFGCFAYEMLSRRPPYSAPSADELLFKHLRAPIPNVQTQNNAVSAEMGELIGKLMAKNPEDREPSMSEVIDRLKETRVYRAGMRPPPPASEPSDAT